MMGSQFPTEGEAVDDDYFVRLLAFMWRCRGLCVLVLAMGAVAGVATQSRSLPFRTTLALRLVSPCVAYRHSDYWTPSGSAWRSQLTAGTIRYAGPRLQITVHAAKDPWLLNVTADHDQSDAVENVLRNLVRETEEQLGVAGVIPQASDTMHAEANVAPLNSAGLTVQLRLTLTRLAKLVAECRAAEIQKSEIVPSATSTFRHPQNVSGTWSPVPIQSVPYYPWFERLHDDVCQQLSDSASMSGAGHLTGQQQLDLAMNLEQASFLVSQVWFSMDPLNPVQKLPQGQIQSVIRAPNPDVSMLLAAGRGCWYAVAFLVIAAMAGEWLGLHWRTVLQSSKASLAHRGS